MKIKGDKHPTVPILCIDTDCLTNFSRLYVCLLVIRLIFTFDKLIIQTHEYLYSFHHWLCPRAILAKKIFWKTTNKIISVPVLCPIAKDQKAHSQSWPINQRFPFCIMSLFKPTRMGFVYLQPCPPKL